MCPEEDDVAVGLVCEVLDGQGWTVYLNFFPVDNRAILGRHVCVRSVEVVVAMYV